MKTNSVAMVTGAGSGIGKAVAMTLARAGYALILNDVVSKAGEQTLQEIQGQEERHCSFRPISPMSHR